MKLGVYSVYSVGAGRFRPKSFAVVNFMKHLSRCGASTTGATMSTAIIGRFLCGREGAILSLLAAAPEKTGSLERESPQMGSKFQSVVLRSALHSCATGNSARRSPFRPPTPPSQRVPRADAVQLPRLFCFGGLRYPRRPLVRSVPSLCAFFLSA